MVTTNAYTRYGRLVEEFDGKRTEAKGTSFSFDGIFSYSGSTIDQQYTVTPSQQTRLSIVDPHSGHQPMTHQQSGVTVVFNGEIFNYLELREQLADRYCFRTRCDTEVILAAFLSQGIDCVRGFIGQ